MGVRGSRTFVPTPFVPWRDVPQLAAGEVWIPAVGVSGTNPVLWAGRNGTNTLTSPAQAPDASTGPGGNPDWTYVAANSDIFNVAVPAGPLVATDGVYVACWFRFDSLDTTSRVIVEQHGIAGSRKWNFQKTASNNVLQVNWSDDGTALLTSSVACLEDEGVGVQSVLDKYLFAEVLIDPTQSTLATKTRLWLDLREQTFSSQTGSGGAALFNGGLFRYGNNVSENQDFNGRLGPLYVGKRANGRLLPTDAHRKQIMRYLSPKDRRAQWVLRGNSLTQGQGASTPGVTSYPGVLKTLLTAAGYTSRDVHDRGLGGATTADFINGFFTNEFQFVDSAFECSYLVFFEVRNSTRSLDATTVYNEHVKYAQIAKGRGFTVVVCTAPPTDGDAVGQGTAGAVNAMIRANWRSFADKFIDLELVPQFTPAGSVANPTYYSDGVHLTDAGYAIIANMVFASTTGAA